MNPDEATSRAPLPPVPASRSGAATPVDLSRNLVAAINAGDLRAASSCFSNRGRLMTPDETILEGRAPIRELLAQLIGMKVRITARPHRVVHLDDRALLTERWQMCRSALDGHDPFAQTTSALSLQRRIDREGWKIVFLAPWGFD